MSGAITSGHRGVLIAVEGIAGSGKTTLAGWLTARLAEWEREVQVRLPGVRAIATREPWTAETRGAWVAAKRRGERLSVEDEVAMFAADRRRHWEQVVGPALDRGDVVLTDRWVPSSLVVQGARSEGALTLAREANAGLPTADLTLLMVVDPVVAAERRQGHDPERVVSLADLRTHETMYVRLRALGALGLLVEVCDGAAGPLRAGAGALTRVLLALDLAERGGRLGARP